MTGAESAGDEADTPYYKRRPRREYVDLARQYMEEFNQQPEKEPLK